MLDYWNDRRFIEEEKQSSVMSLSIGRTRCNARGHYSPSARGWWLPYDSTKAERWARIDNNHGILSIQTISLAKPFNWELDSRGRLGWCSWFSPSDTDACMIEAIHMQGIVKAQVHWCTYLAHIHHAIIASYIFTYSDTQLAANHSGGHIA
jgi:hypothetical protein